MHQCIHPLGNVLGAPISCLGSVANQRAELFTLNPQLAYFTCEVAFSHLLKRSICLSWFETGRAGSFSKVIQNIFFTLACAVIFKQLMTASRLVNISWHTASSCAGSSVIILGSSSPSPANIQKLRYFSEESLQQIGIQITGQLDPRSNYRLLILENCVFVLRNCYALDC